MAISPRLAYMRMLRASSEIAAAMTVWSPLEKPAFAATLRPCWRAVTTSTSDAIGTSSSSGTIDAPLAALDALAGDPVEEGQPFQRHVLVAQQPLRLLDATLQVADGRHLAQVHADRYERLGDLG